MIKTSVHEDLGLCVVKPTVERLTAANATTFKEEVIALLDQKHDRLVIDLAEVSFIDSSGIGALVGVLKRVGTRGEIVVCNLASSVQQMFRITRMDRVFSAYRDVDAAIQALKERA
ncbi:STAS domain-containing protein [Salipiger mucosus]|uniref:Anti-sigma factor antagonist n=1 Tax=Salipiger mucosus DSM 16094 TaxID=1123237 RepID=S9Q5W1_9RHOB|nr:STAS domain-containing protein [Salipiger mucosus]EPX75437.1 anti-sigma F factor antagonist (spoIIAA-2), anti sigma b factor antagonist RsbV [Salipiger mucosus DSM 16094]